jgi:hypothetical protein
MTKHPTEWSTPDGAPPRAVQRAIERAARDDGSPEQVARLGAELARRLGVPSLSAMESARESIGSPRWSVGKSTLLRFGAVLGMSVAGVWAWSANVRTPVGPTFRAPPAAAPVQRDLSPVVEPLHEATPVPVPDPPHPAARARTVRAARGAEKPQASEEDSLAREAALMTRAHAQLRRDPAAALATTGEHQRLYPRGALTQEREAVAVAALRALRRDDEARSRERELERAFPGSPYLSAPGSSAQGNSQAGEQTPR